MSINSIQSSALNTAGAAGARPAIKEALTSTMDVASGLTMLMNALMQNMLKAAQQQPGVGAPAGGAATPLGANGMNNLGGMLQGLTQLLSAIAPLLQALSAGGMGGAKPNAMQFANQLPGAGMGMGSSLPNSLGAAGGALGSAVGAAAGGPAGGALGGALGNAAGVAAGLGLDAARPQMTVLGGSASRPGLNLGAETFVRPQVPAMGANPSLPNALGAAGGALGSAAGGALGGPTGAAVGGAVGQAAGTVAGVALANEMGVPTTARPGFNAGKITPEMPIGSGMSSESALAWAVANGGQNLTTADIKQGMNLYNIFNGGQRAY